MRRPLFAAIILLVASWASAQKAQKASRPTQPAPTPAATAVPTPAAGAQTGESMLEQEESGLSGRSYAYDPAGRRDPFRSLLVRPEKGMAGQRPPGIAGI
jgi:hypothetical protein